MSDQSSSPHQSQHKQSALLRILKATVTLPAQATFFASALAAIAMIPSADLPTALTAIASGIGVNALSSMLERIATGKQVSDNEIRDLVKAAIDESRIAAELTARDTQIMIARLFRRHDVLKFAIQNGEYVVLKRLTEQAQQYEALIIELRDDLSVIYAEMQKLATREQSDEVIVLQREIIALLKRLVTDEPIKGFSPYLTLIEIVPDTSSRIIDVILDDLQKVILKEHCQANVLATEEADDVRKAGVILQSESEIIDAVERAIRLKSRTARRVFEWKKKFQDPIHDHAVVFVTLSDSLLIYLIDSFPEKILTDCASEPIDEQIMGKENLKTFTAFPSIHYDIIKNLNWHSEGHLLIPTYVFGFDRMQFPTRVLEASRLLAIMMDKMVGTSPAKVSEIATDAGRGFMAFSDRLGLVNQVYLFPYDTFGDRYMLFDFIGVFLHDYLRYEGLPPKYQELVLNNLRRMTRLLNSQPFTGGGAFESLIASREAQIKNRQDWSVVTGQRLHPEKEEPFKSLEEIAVAITNEFEVITNTDLTFSQVKRKDKDEYSRIEIVMSFLPGQNPVHGNLTNELSELIDALTTYLAAEKRIQRDSVHSVKYLPFMLQDAIMFVVKVNWKPHDGEEKISVWDIESE